MEKLRGRQKINASVKIAPLMFCIPGCVQNTPLIFLTQLFIFIKVINKGN